MSLKTVCIDPIREDLQEFDEEYPTLVEGSIFNSKGSKLLGVIHIAQGKGPHPTVILFHGFPGYEQNFDIAHVLLRAGYNVFVFHYRGSWGSEGSYSIANVLEDADSAIDFLRSPYCAKEYRVDEKNIILMGHSLGGFTTLMTAARHPEIKYAACIAGFNFGLMGEMLLKDSNLKKETIKTWKDWVLPLKGINAEKVVQEVIENRKDWNLINIVEKLKGHSILIIGGIRDDIATIDKHYKPLIGALKEQNVCCKGVILNTDHGFCDKRISLQKEVLSWLEKERA
ncbi:alpha/beta hydrolase family protein [Clostridium coskatii]|uniref:Esterase n=1 Tax=Clostridium coskatii TaxID=1705578 RepID=A0A162LII0_9CLOT|nr:alpha/beta fold hydrolase [Clostridium coskatii]OAA93946.1 esterase [Clostridium coskatii]OBR95275.1 esterase [Clostridium coskatii]